MSGRKGKELRISNPFVMISSSMGDISPARFANHSPFSVMFSDAPICGKHCIHLSIITLSLFAGVDSIINIAMALTSRATSATVSNSASTIASILREFSYGLIHPILVNMLGAFRDTMIGLTTIETGINAMFLWNIPLI